MTVTGVDEHVELTRAARAVLDANWLGAATRPSPSLYPHQWSWDSAFVATGQVHHDPARATQELVTLFGAQWSNGLLPHIVFTEGVDHYFPGPGFWESSRSPYAPRSVQTSGIVQPPVHATAVRHIAGRLPGRRAAAAFLEALVPKLAAWHAYLYRERSDPDSGLIEIWHPWESGMDNSPLWDDALATITPATGDIPPYERVDVRFAEASQRPTDDDYDRYVYLAKLARDRSYLADRVRRDTPFAVADVLFNSVLVQANRDLAHLAREVGADGSTFDAWADRTAAGIDRFLWSDDHDLYLDVVARGHVPIPVRAGAGFAPLYAGVPDTDRARRLVTTLEALVTVPDDDSWLLPSLAKDDPRFDPSRYWRGPVWPVLQWLLHRGLRRYGYVEEAERMRTGLLALVRRAGFFEHYHPTTGAGGGGDRFTWTAGLVLDLLQERASEGRGHDTPTQTT